MIREPDLTRKWMIVAKVGSYTEADLNRSRVDDAGTLAIMSAAEGTAAERAALGLALVDPKRSMAAPRGNHESGHPPCCQLRVTLRF